MTVAAESLVGCEDAVWSVAAPTACAILCSIGESVRVCSLWSMMLLSCMALPIEASMRERECLGATLPALDVVV